MSLNFRFLRLFCGVFFLFSDELEESNILSLLAGLKISLEAKEAQREKSKFAIQMRCELENLLIVEYYIYHIIINTHVDDDVMAQNMTCLVGTPVHNQTYSLPHGVRPY